VAGVNLLNLTAGVTKPRTFTLYNGDGLVVNLTACTVALILMRDGVTAVDTAGDLAIEGDATLGQVKWSPDVAEVLAGYYTLRVKVTDSEGDAFFPDGPPVRVQVYAQ